MKTATPKQPDKLISLKMMEKWTGNTSVLCDTEVKNNRNMLQNDNQ